jgi:hypothetical protein
MIDGTLSAVRAPIVYRLLSDADVGGDEDLLDLPNESLAAIGVSSYVDLVSMVLEGLRAEGPDLAGHRGEDARQRLADVEGAFAFDSSVDWVIVYCSPCGHMWRKRLPR